MKRRPGGDQGIGREVGSEGAFGEVDVRLRIGGAIEAMDYLLKTEPTEYSFTELVKDGETAWDGVTNPTAVMHLRGMKASDRLVIYETGNVKSAVGTAEVVSVHASDPKKPVVKIRAGKALGKRVSLEEIKKKRLFEDSPLVKIGRLSVVPLTAAQYKALTGSKA